MAALLVLCGCQSAPDLSRLVDRPEDFTVAVTVHNPDAPAGTPRHLRPARFVLEADSVLRWSPGATPRGFPPPIRTLTPAQHTEIWALVRESGLLEPDVPYLVYGPVTLGSEELDGPVALIEIAFAGVQASSQIPLDRSSDESVLAERLVDRLAELAFVSERE